MTDETLTQSELDEIIGKLERALKRGEIEEMNTAVTDSTWKRCSDDEMHIAPQNGWKFRIRRKPIAGWVNVYPNNMPPYASREQADVNAMPLRIACVYVEETEAPHNDD